MSVTLNITATTVIKAMSGKIWNVMILVAGSTAGTVNDCSTTGAVAATNAVVGLPAAVGNITFTRAVDCANGITVAPGTGQTIAIQTE